MKKKEWQHIPLGLTLKDNSFYISIEYAELYLQNNCWISVKWIYPTMAKEIHE